MVTSLVHPLYRHPEVISERSTLPLGAEAEERETSSDEGIRRNYAFTRSDLLLGSSDWSTLLVARVAKEGCLESACQPVRRRAEEALRRELQFCAHLGLSAILVELKRKDNSNLARMIYTFLVKNPGPQVP